MTKQPETKDIDSSPPEMHSLQNPSLSDFQKAQCASCGIEEWIISLDEPIYDLFASNYLCEECEMK